MTVDSSDRPTQAKAEQEKQAQAQDLFQRIKTYGFNGHLSTAQTKRPACKKQGGFKSIGTLREKTPYLHVRREP